MLFLLFVVPAKKRFRAHNLEAVCGNFKFFWGGIAPQDAWNRHRFSETKVNLSFCVGRKLVT